MKIAIVTTHYYPVISGVATVVETSAKYLKKEGYDVYIFARKIDNSLDEENRDGIKIYRYKNFSRYMFSWDIIKLLRRRDFDLIHSHEYAYFPTLISWINSKQKKIPHFHTPHFHLVRNKIKRIISEWQAKKIFKSSNLVALTQQEEKILGKFNPLHLRVIPNPIDTDIFKPTDIKKGKLVLYIGRLADWKITCLPEILPEILKDEDAKAAFIGFGENLKVNSLKKRFPHQITIRKNVSQKELLKWYQKSKVLVLPSQYEAFGMAAVEALACQTPVIASRVGGIKEIVEEGKTGLLFDPKNQKELKEKIIFLLNNKEENEKMGRAGRKFVVENFDSEVVGLKLLKYYKESLV